MAILVGGGDATEAHQYHHRHRRHGDIAKEMFPGSVKGNYKPIGARCLEPSEKACYDAQALKWHHVIVGNSDMRPGMRHADESDIVLEYSAGETEAPLPGRLRRLVPVPQPPQALNLNHLGIGDQGAQLLSQACGAGKWGGMPP